LWTIRVAILKPVLDSYATDTLSQINIPSAHSFQTSIIAVKLSCGLPPSKDVVRYAQYAESLGYERIWLCDSPALYGDVYVALARIAENTTQIGIGTAVAVPNLRHPMVTAAAIATIEDIAPGRLAVAFGAGFTAAKAIGSKPMKWSDLKLFIQQLRALLKGETVYIDGNACQMLHSPGFAAKRPINVPLLLAPAGEKGFAVAREVADGVLCESVIQSGFEWCARMVSGTVMEAHETVESPRVQDAAGPWFLTTYHALWERDRTILAQLPGSTEWMARIEAERPEEERHLAVHEGHIVAITDRDRPLLNVAASLMPLVHWVGPTEDLQNRVRDLQAQGANEIIYFAAGSDICREFKAFAEMVQTAGT